MQKQDLTNYLNSNGISIDNLSQEERLRIVSRITYGDDKVVDIRKFNLPENLQITVDISDLENIFHKDFQNLIKEYMSGDLFFYLYEYPSINEIDLSNINEENEKLIEEIATKNNLEYEDIDDIISNDDGISDAITRSGGMALESGAYVEFYKDFKNTLDGFFVEYDLGEQTAIFNMDTEDYLYFLYEYTENYDTSYKLNCTDIMNLDSIDYVSFSEPSYGWWEFDVASFNESLHYELQGLL